MPYHRILVESTNSFESLEIFSLRSKHRSPLVMAVCSAAWLLDITWLYLFFMARFSWSLASQSLYLPLDRVILKVQISLLLKTWVWTTQKDVCTPVTYVLEFCPLVTLVQRPKVELRLRASSSQWPGFQAEVSSGLECTRAGRFIPVRHISEGGSSVGLWRAK